VALVLATDFKNQGHAALAAPVTTPAPPASVLSPVRVGAGKIVSW